MYSVGDLVVVKDDGIQYEGRIIYLTDLRDEELVGTVLYDIRVFDNTEKTVYGWEIETIISCAYLDERISELVQS